jgi:hypothetical protein
MRRLALMLVTAAVFLARPAWPQDDRPVGVRAALPSTSPLGGYAAGLHDDAGGRASGSRADDGALVLFVPLQPSAHGTGAGTDNYGRPLQLRPLQ